MLTGDLTDFSLRNVLEFLASARKSGLLTIRWAGIDGGVFVRDGGVCLGLVDVTRVPLASRMIALGLVDRADLHGAAVGADGTTFGLACGLMRVATDAAAARGMAVDHTRESLGWLDKGDNATFVFDCGVAVETWPFEPLPAGEVLAEAEHSAEQWAELRPAIDDLSLVPNCLMDPMSTTDVSLTAAQWRVVALVDGQRAINEIIELAGLGQLETCREVVGLVDDGLVELIRPGGHSAIDTLVHDVRAVDAFAFARGALAYGEPPSAEQPLGAGTGRTAIAATTGGPMSPDVSPPGEHPATEGTADADGAQTPDDQAGAEAMSDINVGLLNRLIDGARRR
jgi:hypothetical protein